MSRTELRNARWLSWAAPLMVLFLACPSCDGTLSGEWDEESEAVDAAEWDEESEAVDAAEWDEESEAVDAAEWDDEEIEAVDEDEAVGEAEAVDEAGERSIQSVVSATPPTRLKLTGPVILTTSAQLATAWNRIRVKKEPFYKNWLTLRAYANPAENFVPYQGVQYEKYWKEGHGQAIRIRDLAIASLLEEDEARRARFRSAARRGLLAWARDPNISGSLATSPSHAQDAGLVISRVTMTFADTFALLHSALSTSERSVVRAWLRRMKDHIMRSRKLWVANNYFYAQYYNNHLGAHTMGLAAIGYATLDQNLVGYALWGSKNPRNLKVLIKGVILMPGDAVDQRDPSKKVVSGEIYDRYRMVQKNGLAYAHIHLRFLTLTALMAYNNGRNFFSYVASGGENLRLPFEFYSEFLLTGKSTARTGYYANSPVDYGLEPLYEIAHRFYSKSAPIRRVLKRRRGANDTENLGRGTTLLFGLSDI